jgi:hypothetical protein
MRQRRSGRWYWVETKRGVGITVTLREGQMGNGATREGIPFERTGCKNPPDEEKIGKAEGKTGGIKERNHSRGEGEPEVDGVWM